MEKCPSTSAATVMTFYNDLADEVDQHFARALQSATTPVQSQGEVLPKEHGGCTSVAAKQLFNSTLHTTGRSQYSYSSQSSTVTTSVRGDPPSMALPATTAVFNTHQAVSPFSPPQTHSWAHQPTQHMGQPYHTNLGTAIPPTPSLITGIPNSRDAIIYPEFVNHLVHPEVNSFKDIPKLPGQTNPPPSTAPCLSFSTNTYGPLAQASSQSLPSYSLFHSPVESDSSPVHLSEEDLQQILELNKDNMYS